MCIRDRPNDVIKRLFMLGQVLTLTQTMSDETMELIEMCIRDSHYIL